MILALLLTVAPVGLGTPAVKTLTEPLTHGLGGAAVGQWATFRIDGGGDRVQFIRFAVVGEELDRKQRPAYWLELEIGQHPAMKAPLMQLRMLIARGEGMTKEGVTRIFVAVGAERPNELDDEAVAAFFGANPKQPAPVARAAPLEGLTTFVGQPTRLMTPAGTLTATAVEVRLRSTMVKRIWTSDQVPILHLARLEIPGLAHTIEVRDFGINARSQMVLPAPGTAKIKLEGYDELAIGLPAAGP
jgi:hypothetical protein